VAVDKELDASKGYLGDANVQIGQDPLKELKRNFQMLKLLFRDTENMETKNYLIIQLTYSKLNKRTSVNNILQRRWFYFNYLYSLI